MESLPLVFSMATLSNQILLKNKILIAIDVCAVVYILVAANPYLIAHWPGLAIITIFDIFMG